MENIDIDDALRLYLDHFTLPGESQQVDRIAQVFAQKYFNDNYNSGLLNSSEAAYTLTYLLIILQTDIHSPQVKEKMKLSDFIKIARGINDGKDMSSDYLKKLYESILETPLAIHTKDNTLNHINVKSKQFMFFQEGENMIKEARKVMNNQKKTKQFVVLNWGEYYKPLLELIWSPLLASFSVIFENNNDNYFIDKCLEGFSVLVKMVLMFGMDDIRETLIVTLVKCTNLTAPK